MNAAGHKVLITGGSATLAAAFATRWLAGGGEAVVLAAGAYRGLVEAPPKLVVAPSDTGTDGQVRRWAAQCDLVVHFVVDDGGEDRARTEDVLDANILGTRSVLRVCVETARPVLLAGVDGALHFNRRSTGQVASLVAEEYAAALARRGLHYAIVRCGNVYGPRISSPGGGGVIGHFLACIRDGKPLNVGHGGHAMSPWCFVDDAVDATARVAESLLESDTLLGRTVTVRSGEAVSIAQLAERMARLSGRAPGGPVGGAARCTADRDDTCDAGAIGGAVTGFETHTSLDDGLRQTLAEWGLLSSAEEPAPAAVDRERVAWVRPVFEADDALLADIRETLVSGHVTNNGLHLRDFERQVAAYLGVEDCVAVSSGSTALLLATHALGLAGAKVVLPSFTFIATLNAVVHNGMTPVFCDIEPDTWTLSPTHLSRLLAADPAIRLVIPVNVFGVPPDLRAIRGVLDGTDAVLMLDDAHGLGTEREGCRCGPEPAVRAYSFHATKTLPAVEGGAVVASDPHLLAEVRRLRNHGVASDPLATMPGYNAKMSELHAAVGLRSLRGLAAALARRRQYAERLRRTLIQDCGSTFTVQGIPDSVRSNFQNLGVLCRRRGRADASAVQAALDRRGIETRRYFWPPLHQLPAYSGRFSLPVTDEVGAAILCLPLHSWMDASVLDRLEAALRRVALAPDE